MGVLCVILETLTLSHFKVKSYFFLNTDTQTTWMDLQGIMLSEVSQIKKDKNCDFTYMWNLKPKQNRHREHTGGCHRGGRRRDG